MLEEKSREGKLFQVPWTGIFLQLCYKFECEVLVLSLKGLKTYQKTDITGTISTTHGIFLHLTSCPQEAEMFKLEFFNLVTTS